MAPKKKLKMQEESSDSIFDDSDIILAERFSLKSTMDEFDEALLKLIKIFDLYEKQLKSEKPNEKILESFVEKISSEIPKLNLY